MSWFLSKFYLTFIILPTLLTLKELGILSILSPKGKARDCSRKYSRKVVQISVSLIIVGDDSELYLPDSPPTSGIITFTSLLQLVGNQDLIIFTILQKISYNSYSSTAPRHNTADITTSDELTVKLAVEHLLHNTCSTNTMVREWSERNPQTLFDCANLFKIRSTVSWAHIIRRDDECGDSNPPSRQRRWALEHGRPRICPQVVSASSSCVAEFRPFYSGLW